MRRLGINLNQTWLHIINTMKVSRSCECGSQIYIKFLCFIFYLQSSGLDLDSHYFCLRLDQVPTLQNLALVQRFLILVLGPPDSNEQFIMRLLQRLDAKHIICSMDTSKTCKAGGIRTRIGCSSTMSCSLFRQS